MNNNRPLAETFPLQTRPNGRLPLRLKLAGRMNRAVLKSLQLDRVQTVEQGEQLIQSKCRQFNRGTPGPLPPDHDDDDVRPAHRDGPGNRRRSPSPPRPMRGGRPALLPADHPLPDPGSLPLPGQGPVEDQPPQNHPGHPRRKGLRPDRRLKPPCVKPAANEDRTLMP